MSLHTNRPGPERDRQRRARHLQCPECGTADYVSITAITELDPPDSSIVAVSYICRECGTFQSHPADFDEVAAVQNLGPAVADVLVFGSHYIHCGRPMEKASSESRRLHAAVSFDDPAHEALDVYLSTRVLRCDCGFQIELPD